MDRISDAERRRIAELLAEGAPVWRLHKEINRSRHAIRRAAVPSPESIAAIRELARKEGIFVGPVYTGKGFASLLDHARTGKVEPGSNVAFLHTGDTGNLFEITQVVGDIYRPTARPGSGRAKKHAYPDSAHQRLPCSR
jgi:1-aminocyclopropane-1-carboxylate deaminase/D-cysteine desulfhydrase-like pyridoxal-dependent ACC family enzyme